ncbi:MAG: hypothetical protein J5645_00190, partial [Lachnospiraceae bacterium]|nr:hypothetical protein [Lachnospiraceae bacterium]
LSQDQTLVKSLFLSGTLAFKKPLYPEIYSLKFASVARNFTKNFKVVSLFGFQGSVRCYLCDSLIRITQGLASVNTFFQNFFEKVLSGERGI